MCFCGFPAIQSKPGTELFFARPYWDPDRRLPERDFGMRRRLRKKQQDGSPNRHRDVFNKTQGYVCFSVDSQLSRARQAQSSSLLDLIRSQTEDYQKGILNEDSVSRKLLCYTHCSFKMHACYIYMFGTQTEDYKKGTSE